MFPKIELPVTRVGLSVGVSLSGENLLETGVDGWSHNLPGFPAAYELLGVLEELLSVDPHQLMRAG